jgi:hypothetical protein
MRAGPFPLRHLRKDYTPEVNGVKLELSYKGQNHCEGNIFIYAPKQKVLAAIDIISPGWSTFKHCDASENFRGWIDSLGAQLIFRRSSISRHFAFLQKCLLTIIR